MAGGVFGGDKNQYACPVVFDDEVVQQLGATGRVDFDGPLGDVGGVLRTGINFNVMRFVEQLVGQGGDLIGKCSGEEQILATAGQETQDAAEFFGKSQREQLVGFVEHEGFDGVEFQGVLVDEVEETTGCRDHDIGATAEIHHLGIDRDSADGGDDLWRRGEVLAVILKGFRDLGGEFAGGDQNEDGEGSARGAGLFAEVLEDRQGEGGGFAGPRLGLSPNVASSQDSGYGLRLHAG